jgi:HlyD family secretion protein
MTDDELRTARREILREAGFTFDSRPSPEVLAKAAQIAKARGLDIDFTRRPESSGSNGSGDGARPSPQVSAAAVTRTVFRLIGTDPATARIQPVTIKLGITDGFNTEVLDTLAEGDVVLTSASAASTAGTAAAGGNNPFAPPRMGPPRR